MPSEPMTARYPIRGALLRRAYDDEDGPRRKPPVRNRGRRGAPKPASGKPKTTEAAGPDTLPVGPPLTLGTLIEALNELLRYHPGLDGNSPVAGIDVSGQEVPFTAIKLLDPPEQT